MVYLDEIAEMNTLRKRWVPQQHILHWFWRRNGEDLVADRKLEHDDELVEWCSRYGCRIENAYVVCPDENTFLLFGLTWS